MNRWSLNSSQSFGARRDDALIQPWAVDIRDESCNGLLAKGRPKKEVGKRSWSFYACKQVRMQAEREQLLVSDLLTGSDAAANARFDLKPR